MDMLTKLSQQRKATASNLRFDTGVFPVHTLEHLRRTIQFFNWIPRSKRMSVATDINRELMRRQITVELGPDHPARPYITKKVVVLAADTNPLYADRTRELMNSFRFLLKELSFPAFNPKLRGDINNVVFGEGFIVNRIDRAWQTWQQTLEQHEVADFYMHHKLNTIDAFSFAFSTIRQTFRELREDDVEGGYIYECAINDIAHSFIQDVKEGFIPNTSALETLRLFASSETKPFIIEQIRSCQLEVYGQLKQVMDFDETDGQNGMSKEALYESIDKLESELLNYTNHMHGIVSPTLESIVNDFFHVNGCASAPNTTRLLEATKNKLVSQVDIIPLGTANNDKKTWKTKEIGGIKYDEMFAHVCEQHNPYGKWVSEDELTTFQKLELYHYGINLSDAKRVGTMTHALLFNFKNTVCGLVQTKENMLGLLHLADANDVLTPAGEYFCNPETKAPTAFITTFRHTETVATTLERVTEGITFDDEGQMKFSFSPKTTYMDQYARIHKVLVSNVKHEHFDEAKLNLAYMFHLINETEKVLYGKKRVSDVVKEDARKARMFAMNDFKTNLPIIIRHDPTFNFTEYFQTTEIGKITFGIKPKDIASMKRLLQAILFA